MNLQDTNSKKPMPYATETELKSSTFAEKNEVLETLLKNAGIDIPVEFLD